MQESKDKQEIIVLQDNQLVIMPQFNIYNENEEIVIVSEILETLQGNQITSGFDEKIIEFYLQRAINARKEFSNLLVAVAKKPKRKGSEVLVFNEDYSVDANNVLYWKIVNDYFKNVCYESYFDFPYPLRFIHKGEIFAEVKLLEKNQNGRDVYGKEIKPTDKDVWHYKEGKNVKYDSINKNYFAMEAGYVVVDSSTVSVIPPYLITKDKMQMYFLNLPRIKKNEVPYDYEITEYFEENELASDCLIDDPFSIILPGRHSLIAKGKKPLSSKDASVEICFKKEKTVGKIDEKGNIDFKEINNFINVKTDDLLAIKHKSIAGDDGKNIYGKSVSARKPKDVIIKGGKGTKTLEENNTKKIISKTDGIVEKNKHVISVSPTIYIKGNVNYETGNIDTKANVHVNGKITAGFEVKSKKNITVLKEVENGSYLKANANIEVNGGVVGKDTKMTSQGDIVVKYAENCSLFAKGNILVKRFVRGVKIECLGKIIVSGRGINLKERGAIVGSKIIVKKSLVLPVIGSKAGLRNHIKFGHDRFLCKKIKDLKKTCDQLTKQNQQIESAYEIDINSENLPSIIGKFSQNEKENLIKDIQKIRTNNKKLNMMKMIFEKEQKKMNEIMKKSYVQFSKAIHPPVILYCGRYKLSLSNENGPAKFFLDFPKNRIEKSSYITKNIEL